MRLFGLGIAWIALVANMVCAQLPKSTSYFATIRSFMSSSCRIADTSLNQQLYCPNDTSIQAAMKAGIISGHPDFERKVIPTLYNPKTSAVMAYNTSFAMFGRQFPLTATNDIGTVVRPYVLSILQYESTGIGKMKYCLGEEGYPCDYNDDPRSVMNNTSFSTWYTDSSFYNKRIGYKQPLYQVAANSTQYQFDAANPVHNPLGNSLFDPITLFNLTSKAWPMSYFEQQGFPAGCTSMNPFPAGCIRGKYWFTTEIHTNFQYTGGEQFSFSGDDDVHIFINGRLAINLGGEHSLVFATIDLDTYANELNITKGVVYAFDLFHVERQTKGSNFKLTTTLVETCNVVTSDFRSNGSDVTLGIDWITGATGPTATNDSDWFLLGTPTFPFMNLPTGSYLATIMSPGVANIVSYMFHRNQQNIGSGFSLSFNFRMSGFGHGFAVALHDRSLGLTNFNGGSGPNLGIKNLENSFAVVFDTCPKFPDCTQGQQLSVHYNSMGNHMNNNSISTRTVYDPNVMQTWSDGQVHAVQIFYYSVPNWLEVYIDNSLRLVERGLDIQQIVRNRNAYVGFTSSSSTQGQSMTVEIGQVSVKTVKVDSALAQLVTVPLPLTLVADGTQANGVVIQSRDACSNLIKFGGLAQLAQGRAVLRVGGTISPSIPSGNSTQNGTTNGTTSNGRLLQEQVIVLNGQVVDNNDGSYTVQFSSTLTGAASIFVAFGTNCTWNGIAFDGDATCWRTAIPDALVVVPAQTIAPTVPGKDPNSIAFPWVIVYGVAGGLGGLICCCCFLAACLTRSRRKWRKDKRFVKTGQMALLESQVELTADPKGKELDRVSRKLQATTMEVLKLRAVTEVEQDVESMRTENKKLVDALKGLKRRQLEQDLIESTASKRMLPKDDGGSTSRIEFSQEPVNGGHIPSTGEILTSLPPPPPNVIAPVFVPRNNPKSAFLVSISRRDVDHVISLANDHSSVISGGEVFGQVYENGDVLVMHSTGPGYASQMDKDRFAQSAAFVKEASDYLGSHSAFRVGSWISTSIHGKPVSEVLNKSAAEARAAVNGSGSRYLYILLVQLCGIKHQKMVVTITPYRYDLQAPPTAKSEVGDLYVFEDDADAEASRRHDALEVLRNRPPPLSGPPPPPPGLVPSPVPPQQNNKRRFDDDAVPPPLPVSRPPPPPGLAPPAALSPRRLSVAEDDENPLVPIMDDSTEETSKNDRSGTGFNRLFGGRKN